MSIPPFLSALVATEQAGLYFGFNDDILSAALTYYRICVFESTIMSVAVRLNRSCRDSDYIGNRCISFILLSHLPYNLFLFICHCNCSSQSVFTSYWTGNYENRTEK